MSSRTWRQIGAALVVSVLLGSTVSVSSKSSDGPPDPTADTRPASLPEQPEESAVLRLQHLDTRSAVTVLRSILQVRKIAEIAPSHAIVLHDTPATIEAATRLIAEIDQPVSRWRAVLVASTPDGEQRLRTFDIDRDAFSISYGHHNDQRLQMDLNVRNASRSAIDVQYALKVALTPGESGRRFQRQEQGHAQLGSQSRLALVEPFSAESQRALAGLLGLPGAVSGLKIHFEER